SVFARVLGDPLTRQMRLIVSSNTTPAITAAAGIVLCRAIKTLHNFKPPATEEEGASLSLQFVRKLSGFTRPPNANQLAFERAVWYAQVR
ncbi:MAG: DUF2277 domain-containing protein, partial [Stellaceae bacterium]